MALSPLPSRVKKFECSIGKYEPTFLFQKIALAIRYTVVSIIAPSENSAAAYNPK
jgi:hypothetical protein